MKTFLLTITILLFSSTAFSQELILLTEDAPPNSYLENDELTGFCVEVVHAVLNEIGMGDQKIKIYPWARAYKMLQEEKNIALFAASRTELREHLFKWAGPIATNEVNIYKLRTRKDIQVTSIESLKQYRVGGAHKDQKSQFLLSQGIDLLRVNQDHQNIDKLFSGRIDVMTYSADRLDYDVRNKNLDLNEIELLRNIPEISTDIYVAFSQHVDDRIVAKFQAGFDAIKQNGTHDKIQMKWKTRH